MSVSQIERDPVIVAEILAQGRELFKRYGFKKTTMEDIAKNVGKSKSALYYYFKTKEEIFEAILVNDIRHKQSQVSEAVSAAGTSREKFRAFVLGMLCNVKEKTEEYSVYRAELFENARQYLEVTEEKNRFVERLLKDILLHGIRNGELRPMNSVEMDVWVHTIHWSLKQVAIKIFLDQQYDYFLDQLDFLAGTLFDGITVRPSL